MSAKQRRPANESAMVRSRAEVQGLHAQADSQSKPCTMIERARADYSTPSVQRSPDPYVVHINELPTSVALWRLSSVVCFQHSPALLVL